MNEKDLRDIIAQVLSEMNVTDTASATSAAPAQKADTASAATEDGFVEDVAEIDIKKQYLVEHPVAGDAYYELKQYAPVVWVSAKQVPDTRPYRYWNSVQHIPQHRMPYLQT